MKRCGTTGHCCPGLSCTSITMLPLAFPSM
ncbi:MULTISPECIES: hypothetical protein [Paenibacillus]